MEVSQFRGVLIEGFHCTPSVSIITHKKTHALYCMQAWWEGPFFSFSVATLVPLRP